MAWIRASCFTLLISSRIEASRLKFSKGGSAKSFDIDMLMKAWQLGSVSQPSRYQKRAKLCWKCNIRRRLPLYALSGKRDEEDYSITLLKALHTIIEQLWVECKTLRQSYGEQARTHDGLSKYPDVKSFTYGLPTLLQEDAVASTLFRRYLREFLFTGETTIYKICFAMSSTKNQLIIASGLSQMHMKCLYFERCSLGTKHIQCIIY